MTGMVNINQIFPGRKVKRKKEKKKERKKERKNTTRNRKMEGKKK